MFGEMFLYKLLDLPMAVNSDKFTANFFSDINSVIQNEGRQSHRCVRHTLKFDDSIVSKII